MYKNNKIIVVIPARGGSKGIPRKNVRLLVDKPLIAYSIETAKHSNYVDDVVITTDDDEIKFIAEKFGAKTIKRSGELAKDDVPLDPVIFDAVKQIEQHDRENNANYDYIITIQPTSPLLKTETLDKTIEKLGKSENHSVITVVDDRHLSWRYDNKKNSYYPQYSERLNRQYLPKSFKETGGILGTKREFLKENSRLGNNIDLIEVSAHESIDIDNYEDWWVAERLLNKKRILIKTDASYEIGTGHIYRGLAIASKLLNHDILFLINEDNKLGIEIISNNNYPYLTHKNNQKDLMEKIVEYDPDIVINDILNTSPGYVKKLKSNGYFVINFEDLGEGAEFADIVFDALYEHQIPLKNLYSGHKYYILKDEFYYQKKKKINENDNEEVEEILLTFGGTDPNDLTRKILKAIINSSYENKITVILGLGYKDKKEIKEEFRSFSNISIFENVKNISEYIYNADLIFTSAGRTMYEIASIGVPCVCLCQNKRELTHLFGNAENGFLNLGLGVNVSNEKLEETLENLLNNNKLRFEMNKRMLSIDLKHGFDNIMNIVKNKYKDIDN